jgi:hypothetical protein
MKTIRVTLTSEDLWFIRDSIACNIPSEQDRSDEEQATADKLDLAIDRLRAKEGG